MSLSKMPIIKNYDFSENVGCIYPAYKFSCTKWWKEENKGIIYKADKSGISKVFETKNNEELDNIVSIAGEIMGDEIDHKTIISGGHTVINLADRYDVGDEAIKSTELSFKLIEEFQNKFNKRVEFMVQLNDLYMEQDMDMNTGEANKYREASLKPYIIPNKINDILTKYSEKLDREFQYYYCAEKNMADRFKRYIKQKKKSDENLFEYKVVGEDSYWNININGESINILLNDKPNCVAANAAMLRDIRYDVSSNKIKDNFKSYIGLFPLCSIDNVLNGYKAANAVYDLDLPSYYIFYGKSCF